MEPEKVMDGDRRTIVPVGSGGGGKGAGGGKGGSFNEAPNNLRSRQVAKIIDLIGEGVIQGLANGIQSVVFDTIPVQNADGSYNVQGFAIDYRTGVPNQTVMAGYPGIQQEIPVGLRIKHSTAHAVRIDNSDVDRVRCTVRVPSLTESTDTALKGSRVEFSFWIQANGGGYKLVDDTAIEGKTTGPYQRSYTFGLKEHGPAPWDVKVVRDSPDATSIKINNELWWDSYTELTDARIRYRNSAIVGITIDAEQFSATPQRMYDIYGLMIQVPVNYDPVAGLYSGIWNGQFKTAWSNNPAWVFYDLVLNKRYGLGDYITAAQIDKWALYAIGVWCDELVPDGGGRFERRWTCNCRITDRSEAFDLLQQMASVFRGNTYWVGGLMTSVADRPTDVVGTYTNANVEDGLFTYQGSDRRARHTQAAVAWLDPENLGQRRIALVEDIDGIQRYGLNRTDVVAIGCTSEGQAHRIGKWTLFTELNETETVSFKTGLAGAWCRPGDIIQISDITITGERRGGRTISGTTTQVTLDAAVTFHTLTPAYLSCTIISDAYLAGTSKTPVETMPVIIPALDTPVTTLDLALPFSKDIGADAIWVLTTSDLKATLWRVINLEEQDGSYAVTAVTYTPLKWAVVERNVILAERDISNRPKFDVRNLTASEALVALSTVSVGVIMTLSWTSEAPYFDIDVRPVGGNWTRSRSTEQSFDAPVSSGTYEYRVTPIDMVGFRGKMATGKYTVAGLSKPPSDVDQFRIQILGAVANFQWAASPDLDVQIGGNFEIRYSPSTTIGPNWTSTIPVANLIPGKDTVKSLPNRPGTYLIKAKDSRGIYSKNAAVVVSYAPDTDAKNFFRIDEHPDWQGSKIGTEIKLPQEWLVLGQTGGGWDDQIDAIDNWPDIDILPTVIGPGLNFGTDIVGTYDFFNRIDLGGVFTTVLTVDMLAFPFYDISDFVDDRPDTVDDWQDWDSMDANASGQVHIRVSQSDDDPLSPTATWSALQPFVAGEYTGRAFEFQAVLVAPIGQQVGVETLSITADLNAKADHGEDIAWNGTQLTIPFNVKFFLPPAITIQIQDAVVGDYAKVIGGPTNKTTQFFKIELRNAAGNLITGAGSRSFDWQAQGY